MSSIKNARKSMVSLYAEDPSTDLGTDPASPVGFTAPMAAELSATGIGRDLIPVPLFRGDFNPDSLFQGDFMAALSLKLNLDAIFVGRAVRAFTGLDSSPVARAEGYLHEFAFDPSVGPGGHQLQADVLEGAFSFRSAGMRGDKFGIQSANKGPTTYNLDLLGIGLLIEAALGGGTPSKDAFTPFSYLDGYIRKNGTLLGNVGGHQYNFARNCQRVDVVGSGGIAADIIPDALTLTGQLDTFFQDLDHYNEAKNFSDVEIECLWGDKRLDLMTQFFQIIIPKFKFSLAWPTFTTKGPIAHSQKCQMDLNETVSLPARLFTKPGPFNIPASSNLGIKVNGGGTVTKAITTGAARTAAQIAADIGTVSGLLAADTWPKNKAVPIGPRLLLETSAAGSTKSIQIDTTVTGDCSAVLGLSNVASSGRDPVAALIRIFNQKSTPYDGTT